MHESDLYPGVPKSVLESLTTSLVGMESVQPMSLSKTHVKRYDNPESGCESYMPAAFDELSNSNPLTVPKPFETLKLPALSTTQSLGEMLCPRSIRRLSVISESVCPKHPRSRHKHPECPPPEPQQARSP
ncbi:hypothetical protein Tco_0316672 [Tanacetum coccineum]